MLVLYGISVQIQNLFQPFIPAKAMFNERTEIALPLVIFESGVYPANNFLINSGSKKQICSVC